MKMKKDELVNIALFLSFMVCSFLKDNNTYSMQIVYANNETILQKVRAVVEGIASYPSLKIQSLFYGKNPECLQCGNCCRYYTVHVTPSDIKRLAEHLEMSVEQFVEEYTYSSGLTWNKDDRALKKVSAGEGDRKACVFLRKEEGNHKFYCSVHEVKPDVCRSFKPGSRMCKLSNARVNWHKLIKNILSLIITPQSIVIYALDKEPLELPLKEYRAIAERVEALISDIELPKENITHIMAE